jgi:hypothetical protein
MRDDQGFDLSTEAGITPADTVEKDRALAGRNEQGVGEDLIFPFSGVIHKEAGGVLDQRVEPGDRSGRRYRHRLSQMPTDSGLIHNARNLS